MRYLAALTTTIVTFGLNADITITGAAKLSYISTESSTVSGIDTISGRANGFTNVAPDLGMVASDFSGSFDQHTGNYSSFAYIEADTANSDLLISGFMSTNAESTPVLLESFAGVNDFTDSNFSTNLTNSGLDTSNSTFQFMSNATFATFDSFAQAESTDAPFSMINLLSKTQSMNGYRSVWEDEDGNRLTSSTSNTTSGGSTASTVSLEYPSGQAHNHLTDGGAVLTSRQTYSALDYLNPNYISSVTDMTDTGSYTLINNNLSNSSYIYSFIDSKKSYILPETGSMRFTSIDADGDTVIGVSYQGGYGLSLSNNLTAGSSGVMSFKLDSNGSYQELGNYTNSSACSWNSSIICEKLSIGTIANDISNDSSTVVGSLIMVDKGKLSIGDLSNALGFEAFTWSEIDGYTILGSLSSSKLMSIANAVNSDGTVVVGVSEGNNGLEAFKWTSSSGLSGLGDLSGGEYFSNAIDISDNGLVIVGFSSVGSDLMEAFRWTSTDGMVGLGRPSSSTSSIAIDISGNGEVIVGAMGDLTTKSIDAFRWDADNGMRTVTEWLSATGGTVPSSLSLDLATSTNEDGSIIGGMSDGTAWLAFQGRGVIFPDSYRPTLIVPKTTIQNNSQLMDLSLEGSHHLPLKSMSRTSDECFWANGDLNDKHSQNTYIKLVEVGSCLDINSDTIIGLGIGSSSSNKNIVNQLSNKIDGQYLYGEIGSTPLNNKDIVLSFGAFSGSWDSEVRRYYLNSGVYDSSIGKPDVKMNGFKLRADYLNYSNFHKFSISPSLSITRSMVKTDSYTENGGGFPAQFNTQKQYKTTIKAGVTAERELDKIGTLRIMIDRLHESSRSNSNISGSVTGWMAFDIENNLSDDDETRIAFELDKRVDKNSKLSTLISFKSDENSWNNLMAISYKYGF